jgi:hypothetical protein
MKQAMTTRAGCYFKPFNYFDGSKKARKQESKNKKAASASRAEQSELFKIKR